MTFESIAHPSRDSFFEVTNKTPIWASKIVDLNHCKLNWIPLWALCGVYIVDAINESHTVECSRNVDNYSGLQVKPASISGLLAGDLEARISFKAL